MRRPILAANWKMNKTASQAQAFAELLFRKIELRKLEVRKSHAQLPLDIVIAAPFTALDRLGRALGGSEVSLAAQNLNAEPNGAHTGEISASMLSELGCRYAIVGHSERRALYAETSADVSRKAALLQRLGICPIVCVGETLEDRERGLALEVVGKMLTQSLAGVSAADGGDLVVAYEPVWAIGTGRNATPESAQELHAFLRRTLYKQFGAVAESIRIQYGGSVNPANATALMAQPDIDGALVEGASLEADSFAALIKLVAGGAA